MINDMPVKPKRSAYHYSHPTTLNKAVPQAACVSDISLESSSSSGPKPATAKYLLKDDICLYIPGGYRQMFYQLYDLDVDKVKEIIHKNDGKEEVCDERDGWCLPHTPDELRNIISGMIQKHIQVKQPASSNPMHRRARPKTVDSGEDEDDDDEDYKPSDESDNEMETELADYM